MSSPGAPAIRPKYAEKFRCIGPACEDTCCQGWNIFIDKSTYAKYQAIPDGPLRVMVDQCIEQTGRDNDFEHARIKLDEDGVCPFLAADRLCAIQKEHGESYLSRTCSQYPKLAKTIDGIQEQTLLLSCPEAARLVLLDRKLVRRKKTSRPASSIYRDLLDPNLLRHALTPLSYFWPIRNFIVLLLEDRSYPLWQRVLLLNMFCKRLQVLTDKRQWHRIPALLSEHIEIVANGSLRAPLNAIPAQTATQLGIVMTLIEDRASSASRNRRFAECIEDFARGIGHTTGSTATDLAENYIAAHDRYYQPWMAKHEFMLENYLLNYVFGHLFPFGKLRPDHEFHPHREAQLLCFQYGLIKGLLIGMAGHYQSDFNADHAVKLVQSFSKAIEHNAGLLKRIENFFAANNLNDTNGIAALLRDGAPEAPAQPSKVPAQAQVSPL